MRHNMFADLVDVGEKEESAVEEGEAEKEDLDNAEESANHC